MNRTAPFFGMQLADDRVGPIAPGRFAGPIVLDDDLFAVGRARRRPLSTASRA